MSGQHDQLAGKVKEFEGKLTGDAEREAEGKAQNLEGKIEKCAEEAVDSVKGVGQAAADKIPGR